MKIIVYTICLFSLLLFLIILLFGNYRRKFTRGKCPEWMRGLSFVHRGIHNDSNVDENSLLSFKKAIEFGYAIELDVRYTKDMIPMVIHDNDLTRMTGTKARLSSLTYDQVKRLDFIKSNEPIPSLKEALELIDGKVPLLVEIKAYHFPGLFEKRVVELLASYKGKYAIQSYNPLALNVVRRINPSITLGLLLDDIPSVPMGRHIRILKDNLLGFICRPAFITYNSTLLKERELDIFRTEDNIVYGFNFKEKDLEPANYKTIVDGIIFER